MYKDLYNTLEPIMWVWRFVGAYPFVIRGPIGSQQYVLSTYSIMLSLIFLIVTLQYCYKSVDFINQSATEYSLFLITISVQQVSNVICFFDSVVLKLFFGKKITRSIENIAIQDKKLSKIGCSLNYSQAVRKGRLYIFILFIFLCFHIHSELVYFNGGAPLLLRIFGNYLAMLQVANVILFAWLMFNVGLRFQVINCKIKTCIFDIEWADQNSSCLLVLRTTAKAHAQLCQAAKIINGTFVLSIINCVLSAFIFTTTMLYYIFMELKNTLPFSHAVYYCSVILIHATTIVIIVQSCNWVHRNAHATVKVLHEFSKENNRFDDDKHLNQIIHNFSMQILHHNLTFSAWGLFPIDSTLLQSLAEAVTTYLVILIQFDPLVT
ncbi:gustatory receptor 4 [Nasonia vitripennis]|uniref:Gustatory receptor n=1 Tax=Nasonia vitripennis TaxID=7425 RepID=A0A7M6UGQ2_NASVI|nr:gustatory receptor 4 [Nasonia vitripennis]